jgi:hypothetical protein
MRSASGSSWSRFLLALLRLDERARSRVRRDVVADPQHEGDQADGRGDQVEDAICRHPSVVGWCRARR